MYKKYILFLLVIMTLTSCSEGIAVFVKIIGLDSATDKLEIEFDFKRFNRDEKAFVQDISIYKNDTLRYELSTDTNLISEWIFPDVPEGFRIVHPKGIKEIENFLKSDELVFEFSGHGKKAAYGIWQNNPIYSSQKSRWMFDGEGNKKVNIDCLYEVWLGKDIISIDFNEDYQIDNHSFQLFNDENQSIAFELKTKKKLTHRAVLVLKKDLKKGEKIFLTYLGKGGESYEEMIVVPGKSSMGLFGKLNGL